MSADAYLQQILNREAVDTGIFSPVRGVQATLEPTITMGTLAARATTHSFASTSSATARALPRAIL